MSATEKKKGAEQVCDKCNTALICNKITREWQGKKEVKLQWQVKETGKAHFKFAGEGKYDCINIPEKKNSVPDSADDDYLKKKQSELLSKKSKLTAQQKELIDAEIDLLQEIEKIVIEKLSADTSPQKVGMYIKLVRDRMEEKQ